MSLFFLYHPFIPHFLIQRIFYFLVAIGVEVVQHNTEQSTSL